MTNTLLLTDFYKVGHVFQYPKGTEYVYSNLTPRKSRIPGCDHMVFFGLQYFLDAYLVEHFKKHFFSVPRAEVERVYSRRIKHAVGGIQSVAHILSLHDLGYLPVRIKALDEGTLVPMRVPCMTIVNTLPEFYWVTNWMETILSTTVWQPCTSATIAWLYKKLLTKHAIETGMPPEFVQWQAHDFSFRGMSSFESAITSGMGHLTSFTGTDTIPAICALEKYYEADCEKELIGGSVNATEHSVMCAGGHGGELDTFSRLITEVYPSGIVSIVSDTWNLWDVLRCYMPVLKEKIMARDGKVVIRPDSGDPVKIICGDKTKPANSSAYYGVVDLLWQEFGGTVTSTGHRLLDPHVGVIYGDSITLERANAIAEGLKANGYASQCVYGIGSFTYQHNTRDTLGTAMKATYVVVDGKGRAISKNPITDDGTKKSATGLLRVGKLPDGALYLEEDVDGVTETCGELKTVFIDGKITRRHTLAEIRARIEDRLSA